MREYTIDATNKRLGRIATEAATVLRGKDTPEFEKNSAPEVKVYIINASQINLPYSKKRGKKYTHYSGYPGGLITRTAEDVIEKKGYSELARKAVYGMLPVNRLRKRIMKNLIVSE